MASHIIRRIINPQNAPKPIGPYSKGVLVDKTLYLSGQIGVDPSTNDLVKGIDNQTRQALENMKSLLVEAGCSFDNVVKVTIYLTDMQNYAKVNEVYGSYFSNVFPARTCFQVGGLPKESLVEIDAIAVLGPITEK